MNLLGKILLLFISLGIVSCGGNKKEQLRIYMWTDNIPQDVYKDFEKETGIRVVEDAVSSNEEMYTKVKSSTANYDIITPSLDYAAIVMQEGLVEAVDKEEIPNMTNIDPEIMKKIAKYDSNHQYIIPFAFGVTAIAYDTNVVTNEVKGFEIFDNPDYKGRMTLLNDMRETFGSTLLYLGYSIDETNQEALSKAQAQLQSWKQNILKFDSDSFQIAYANGEVDLVHGYPDTILPNLSATKRQASKFIVPEKGAIMWVDSFLILKNAPNKSAALKFINFIHRPDIYARIMDSLESLSLNVPARELMTVQSPISYDQLSNVSMLEPISPKALEIQSRIWENIQAQ
ncbi:MAG: extracellular solute-binding protein [Brevinemataceae bacterium]